MKKKFNRIVLFIIISLQIILIPSVLDAQGRSNFNAPPGGGGNGSGYSDDSGGSSGLLYFALAGIAALVIWKVFLDKKEDKPKEKDKNKPDSLSLEQKFNNIKEIDTFVLNKILGEQKDSKYDLLLSTKRIPSFSYQINYNLGVKISL